MQKSGIFGILEYSEPFRNCILTHTQHYVIFTKIGKPSVTLQIEDAGQAFFQALFYNRWTVVKSQSWIESWNSISSCFVFFFFSFFISFFEKPFKNFPFYSTIFVLFLWFRYLQKRIKESYMYPSFLWNSP